MARTQGTPPHRRHRRCHLHTPPSTPARCPPPVRLSVPRALHRPPLRPVAPAALAALDPALANVPVAFVRQRVCAMASDICDVLRACTPTAPLVRPLPRSVVCRAPSAEVSMLPTHLLVVYNPRTPAVPGKLFAAHSLVLAAQCGAVPRFGPTVRDLHDDGAFSVPLVGMPVPAPHAFSTLFVYLHTHNVHSLLAALLPLPAAALDSVAAAAIQSSIVELLAEWHSLRALLSALKMCHGVWANAVALHVNDDPLWKIIQYAWAILIQAVDRSANPRPSLTDDEDADAVDRAIGDVPPYEA